MSRDRRILGFDARLAVDDHVRPPWSLESRDTFLLRPQIEVPFSVDPNIWPTCFLYHFEIRRLAGTRADSLIDADPDCQGSLWLNPARMRQRLAERRTHAVLVAIELLAPENTTVQEYPSPLIYSQPDPAEVPAGSVFLGYDVADAGFLSGLSNCGYSVEERETLRPYWASRVNDFGLLQTEQDAFAFRDLSDRRVPEHAPFWVYGLYRLE